MAKDLEIKVKLAIADLEKGVAQSRSVIKSLDKEKAQIILDLKKDQLLDDFNKIRANLKELNAKPVTAQIQVEKEKALTDLAQIKTQLRGIDKIKLDIEVPKNTALELRAIGESFSAISGVLTQLKNDAVSAFKEFDAAKTKLGTIGKEGKELGNSLGSLSKELGYQVSATDLANASYSVLSAGFTKTADSTKVLNAASVGSVAGFSDVDTVTKGLVSTLNAYSLSADSASSVVDKFAAVQQNGLITINDYASQISKIAPLANAAGVQLDELNGFIATATKSGVPAEQTFSGLRQAISATLKPSSEATELAKQLGIQFDAQALKTKGLSGIIGELNVKGLDSAQNLNTLFGSVEALTAITPSTGKGFKTLTDNISASANSAGTAKGIFNEVSNSVGGRAKALQVELNQALSDFGEKILAVTNPVVQGTTAIIRAFNGLPAPVQSAIAIFVGGGAAVAAFGAAVATILAIAGPTLQGLTLLSGGVATFNAILTANISLSGLAAAGEAALGVASAIASGQITGASIATGALTAATGALTIAVAPAIAAVAILAAGLAAINFIRYTKDLEELNAALETNAATAQTTGNETFALANKLKALGEARKAGNGDDKKESGFLNIAKEDIAKLEDLKKQQDEIASKASDPSQKQSALNLAKDYETQTNALKGQVAELEKIRSAKDLSTEATKQDTKAIKEQLAEQQKLAKAKADIDLNATAKKQDLQRQGEQKSQEKGIETKRDDALAALKIKQEQEIGKFKDGLENSFNAKKLVGEKAIADFKAGREAELEKLKNDTEQSRAKLAETFQTQQQGREDKFRQSQEAADRRYQKEKEDAQKKLNDSLSGAKGIVDREAKLGGADPKEAEKLRQQFAEEDRIKQQVASTNVDKNSSKEQFANQAKQIAGVGQIKTSDDQAKVTLALAELEAKAKAQLAEEERKKDEEFKSKQQKADAEFKESQRILDVAFKEEDRKSQIDFEASVLKPQREALAAEVQTKEVAFKTGVLQPLELKQKEELALFEQQKKGETQAIALGFEKQLEDSRTAAKIREIDLDAVAQKDRLDREAIFKDSQRALDLQNATQIASILSTAKLEKANLLGAVGIAQPTKISGGIQNLGNGLDKLRSGVGSIPTNSSTTTNNNSSGLQIGSLTVQTPDPVKDLTGVLREFEALYR